MEDKEYVLDFSGWRSAYWNHSGSGWIVYSIVVSEHCCIVQRQAGEIHFLNGAKNKVSVKRGTQRLNAAGRRSAVNRICLGVDVFADALGVHDIKEALIGAGGKR